MKSLSLQSICQATMILSTVPCGLVQTITRMNCLHQYRITHLPLKDNEFTDLTFFGGKVWEKTVPPRDGGRKTPGLS